MKAELAAVYNSRRLSGANTLSRAVSQVDIAFQKTLLQDKATVRFAINDIYKGNQSRYTQNFLDLFRIAMVTTSLGRCG